MAIATPGDSGVGRLSTGVETTHPRGWVGVTPRKCFRILIALWGWGREIAVIAVILPQKAKFRLSGSPNIARDRRDRKGRVVKGEGTRPGTGYRAIRWCSEQRSDSGRAGASNMLGLSSGALSAAQPQNRARCGAPASKIETCSAQRVESAPWVRSRRRLAEQNREERRAEQGIKEFDFDR